MNLLITNPQESQAYEIICCLRAYARRIIITEGGDSVASTGFRGLASYSRFVHARYQVPHFADDWLAGRLLEGNTKTEEIYIRRIEEICNLERVDVILPSLDPEVYLFAKNKQRLLDKGILAVVPEPDVVRVPMDKALTIRAAQRVGFPSAKTYFPTCDDDIDRIIADGCAPWIVKPRFTAHAAHMVYVAKPAELRAAFSRVRSFQEAPMVQEYLVGGRRRNYQMMIGRDSEILSFLSPNLVRAYRNGFKVSSRAQISATTAPFLPELRALVKELRLWGGYSLQTQIDPRDGLPKLLEINPRFGQHLWCRTRLGVNEPLIFLQLARGERPTGNLSFPEGVMLLDPISDFLYLCNQAVETTAALARRLLRRPGSAREASDVNPEGVLQTLRVLRRDYLNGRRKVFCPEFANLLVDPWPCIRFFWFKVRGMASGYLTWLATTRSSEALNAPASQGHRSGQTPSELATRRFQ